MVNSARHGQPLWPIEEVARYPRPGMAYPGAVAFDPHDRLVTYLWSPRGDLTRQLYIVNLQTGVTSTLLEPPDGGTSEDDLSLEEALRRERQRRLEVGVTEYAWAERAARLVIPLQGNIYLQDGPDAALRLAVPGGDAPLLDPQLSPDGRWVAYVQDAELYVVSTDGGEPRQLTLGARCTGKTHGLAEYIAQEEMERRHGFWWSSDGNWIAFAAVDETHIPVYRIVHQGKDEVGIGAQEDHRYPFAGQANARVRLGVAPAEGGEPVWMDLGEEEDIYLARVTWLPDGRLGAQVENRAQSELQLLFFDPRTGRRRTVLKETSALWINLHRMYRPLKRTGGFIWASERTGFRHLYLYDQNGILIRPLTEGEWIVDAVVGIDEDHQLVYFTGTYDTPTESHLYVAPFSGGAPRRITAEPGMHNIVVDHACQRFVDTHHSLNRPPNVTVRSLADGEVLHALHDQRDPRIDELRLRPPELVSLQNRDGTTLYGAIYRPPASVGPAPYPAIVSVYGGPDVQFAANDWMLTADLRAQYLSQLGFLVFKMDNRGSARRGLVFEGALRHNMGDAEVQDQVDGVEWLVDQGLADPDRIGVYGWSYGGYMAVMCLARAPETFHVAVAGAPVAHWDGYDTHYTERYMGTPQANPAGYTDSSLMHHVEGIKGHLLLVHGLIDENVHFRHTARLINALISARKPYDLLLFPDERHTPRKLADRVYMEERIRDYFLRHL